MNLKRAGAPGDCAGAGTSSAAATAPGCSPHECRCAGGGSIPQQPSPHTSAAVLCLCLVQGFRSPGRFPDGCCPPKDTSASKVCRERHGFVVTSAREASSIPLMKGLSKPTGCSCSPCVQHQRRACRSAVMDVADLGHQQGSRRRGWE
jgi:hypothetical protein